MKKQDSKKVQLEVMLREEIGKKELKQLRRDGFIPAVVYGRSKQTQSIGMKKGAFLKFFHEFGHGNTIIDLQIMKDSKSLKIRPVLIKTIQYDPLTSEPLHIDFYEISLTEVITVQVELDAMGEPVGVKQDGGMLEHHLWELNVECLPTEIPEKIVFDVTELKMGEVVHIKDLSIPMGVKVLHEPDLIVFSVIAPKKMPTPEEEAAAAEGVSEEPEVLKEKKPEEEAEKGEDKKEDKKEEKKKEEKKG